MTNRVNWDFDPGGKIDPNLTKIPLNPRSRGIFTNVDYIQTSCFQDAIRVQLHQPATFLTHEVQPIQLPVSRGSQAVSYV